MQTSEFQTEVRRWAADPTYFVTNVLGVKTLWEKQVEILEALRDHPRVAVAACHDSVVARGTRASGEARTLRLPPRVATRANLRGLARNRVPTTTQLARR